MDGPCEVSGWPESCGREVRKGSPGEAGRFSDTRSDRAGEREITVRKQLSIVLLALLGAAVTPVLAGGGGFYFQADALAMRPTNSSLDYVILDPDTDLAVEGSIRAVDPATATVPRMEVGMRWSATETISLSWWSYDETERESLRSGGGLLWDVLSPPNISLLGYEGRADASYKIKSTVVDLLYEREVLTDEEYTAGFSVGLRYLEYESDFTAGYEGLSRSVTVRIDSDSTATGARAAVYGVLNFGGGRWSLRGEAAYSLLLGDTDILAQAASISAFPSINVTSSEDKTFNTIEGKVTLTGRLASHVDLRLALMLARWLDTVESPRFLDDINQASFDHQTTDAQWAGLSLGFRLHW